MIFGMFLSLVIGISVIFYFNKPFCPETSPADSWASADVVFGCLKKNWCNCYALSWPGTSVPAGASGESGLLWIEVVCALALWQPGVQIMSNKSWRMCEAQSWPFSCFRKL